MDLGAKYLTAARHPLNNGETEQPARSPPTYKCRVSDSIGYVRVPVPIRVKDDS